MGSIKLQETKGDDWNVLAEESAKITEQTSSASITLMLERANAVHPFSQASSILDNGCGPGLVMSRILKDYGSSIPSDCPLTCADFSPGMIAQVRVAKDRACPDSPSAPVQPKIQNAMDHNELPDDSQTHVTAGMGYFMVPSTQKALRESLRVLKPSGVLACSAWEGSQWMDLMNLLPKIRSDKVVPSMPVEWQSAAGIKAEMEKAGFRDVAAHECPVKMPFQSHDSFVEFLLTKLPHIMALKKDMSEDEVGRLKALMVEEMRKVCPEEPSALDGLALVGVGRK